MFFIACRLLIPNDHHFQEIRLRYDGNQFSSQLFNLKKHGNPVFTSGQQYSIALEIVYPDSPSNQYSGMLGVDLSLFDDFGSTVFKLSNSFLPVYRPWIISALDTCVLSFFYETRILKKQQTIYVSLEDVFFDNLETPSVQGQVTMSADKFEWYSVRLIITAILTPFTAVLSHHTWLVGLLFVGVAITILNLLLTLFLIVQYRESILATSSQCITLVASFFSRSAGTKPVAISELREEKDNEETIPSNEISGSSSDGEKDIPSVSLKAEGI